MYIHSAKRVRGEKRSYYEMYDKKKSVQSTRPKLDNCNRGAYLFFEKGDASVSYLNARIPRKLFEKISRICSGFEKTSTAPSCRRLSKSSLHSKLNLFFVIFKTDIILTKLLLQGSQQ